MTKISDTYEKEIKQLTDAMRYKLHINRHKGKWEGADLPKLFDLLLGEIEELRNEIESAPRNEIAVLLEGSDCANYIMMIVNLALRNAAGDDKSALTDATTHDVGYLKFSDPTHPLYNPHLSSKDWMNDPKGGFGLYKNQLDGGQNVPA